MTTNKTPGVYIEEIPSSPRSIVSVDTTIPVFIGFTVSHADGNSDNLLNKALKIHSIAEFEQYYGTSTSQPVQLKFTQRVSANTGETLDSSISLYGSQPILPTYFLYYSIKLYFANGGGPCYVFSLGAFPDSLDTGIFTNAFSVIQDLDEVSLIAFPDVCRFPKEQFGDIVDTALSHCEQLQDRFLVVDVLDAVEGGNDNIAKLTTNFREKIFAEARYLKFGAAHYPYLKSNLSVITQEEDVIVSEHVEIVVNSDGRESVRTGNYQGLTLDNAEISIQNPLDHSRLLAFAQSQSVTLPPSGAVLGAIVRNDNSKGVWKAPANISLSNVEKAEISMTNEFQEALNVDVQSGKSINVIRHFTGKGIMIWGARTLAGNDNEWRYVPVMRFFIMLKESIQKGTLFAVFEPNDQNLWVRLKAVVENYLVTLWRDGALAGAKPEDAFFVKVGLGETMTEDDILSDRLIIQIGFAPVRPAEFIIFRIIHKVQKPIPETIPPPQSNDPATVSFTEKIKQLFRRLFSWLGIN